MANILIAEDQADLAFLITTCLSANGHTPKTVFSEGALYECIASFIPQVIVLDVQLGENNGRNICQQLKQSEWRNVPIIIYSSIVSQLEKYETIGASARLLKPFTIKALNDIIKKLLETAP